MTEDVTEDSPQTSGFLAGLEFLTGEDPSAGSFLLVVGMVTCVFIAAFQFTLTPPDFDTAYGARSGHRRYQLHTGRGAGYAQLLRHAAEPVTLSLAHGSHPANTAL